ncbi:arginine vasopressin-induced protein 1-like [Solea solea]|uniref:arginine vasopressin-induced protein 1-like n=1 Tax=Solea solea TaxID=90069 RepID=UPI00272C62AE|nr:arginine vasopressin-induced protein 1-like [Solea solea]
MPPFPVFLYMDSGPASPPSSAVASPSPLWRLAERRSRKAGAGNIFSSVNLWQLQRLFRAAGDQDAEQRAQLVWGHRDEAELAQALIGLRTRSHRRVLRSNGRDALESRWLRAFNQLRIKESSLRSPGTDSGEEEEEEEESDSEAAAHSSTDPQPHSTVGTTGRDTEATAAQSESHSPAVTSNRPTRVSARLRRAAENDPERYLHRILH